MFSRGKRWQERRTATSSRPLPKLASASVVAAIVIVAATACRTGPRVAEVDGLRNAYAYLRAWEAEDYDAMCAFVKTCEDGPTLWLEPLRSFPVHVRYPEIIYTKQSRGGVFVRYSIEMPDIGSIICAAASPSPRAAAALLVVTGRYVRWKDTLWLARAGEHQYVVVTPESEKSGSNTLARWIQGVGIYVMNGFGRARFRERASAALTAYFVESEKTPTSEEGNRIVRRAARQCRAYLERASLH